MAKSMKTGREADRKTNKAKVSRKNKNPSRLCYVISFFFKPRFKRRVTRKLFLLFNNDDETGVKNSRYFCFLQSVPKRVCILLH